MRYPLPLIVCCLLVLTRADVFAGGPPDGFEAIFNGKDLTGWDGSAKHWKVENGALTGTADGKLDYNRFIVWRGGKPKNFEIRVKVKVTAKGNSGINYRSTERPDLGESVVTGYQCDIVANRADYNGMLYEERGRRILAHTGEKVIIDQDGQPWVVAKLPLKEFKPDEWHDFRILVRGNHHQHWIDSQQTVDVIDLDEKGRKLDGVLALQVHVGPPMKIQFKDFYLKKLPDDIALITPEMAQVPADAVKVVPQGKGKAKKAATSGQNPPPDKNGWYDLFDGKTLDGWKAAEEPGAFKVENGLIVAGGTKLTHLYYAGPVQSAKFKDFELKAEVKTRPKGNSGILFHTEYQAKGFPDKGFEFQINNTGSDKVFRTGSIYPARKMDRVVVKDDEWFECRLLVKGNKVVLKVNGEVTMDTTLPLDAKTGRTLAGGTFAIQGHDPGSIVYFRSIRVKPLAD